MIASPSLMDVTRLIFLLGFYVAAGTFISMGMLNRFEIGQRYFYFFAAIWAFAGTWFLTHPAELPIRQDLYAFVPIFCFLAFLNVATANHFPKSSRFFYWAATICAVFIVVEEVPSQLLTHSIFRFERVQFQINALLSMLLLGFGIGALFLRQWSKWRTHLPVKNLQRLTSIFLIFVFLRVAFGIYMMNASFSGKSELELYRSLFTDSPGIFFLLRSIWGLLGPLLLGYFVWRSARLRLPHTSVGILYASSLCVLTGEALSQYLAWVHGFPF
jgi:hypothetical protein